MPFPLDRFDLINSQLHTRGGAASSAASGSGSNASGNQQEDGAEEMASVGQGEDRERVFVEEEQTHGSGEWGGMGNDASESDPKAAAFAAAGLQQPGPKKGPGNK